MYKLLIVDDEPFVLNHLVGLFRLQDMYELDVLKANSAVAALELLENHRVDIILSDIEMPRMSGLEFCNIVLKKWKETKFVFLTAYQKFEHIYDAVKIGVIDFILKTESDEHILSVVGKAIDIIENELRHSAQRSGELYQKPENIFMVEDMLFKPVLQKGDVDHAMLVHRLGCFGINIDPFGKFLLCLLRFDNQNNSYFTYERLGELLHQLHAIYRYNLGDEVEVVTLISDTTYQNLKTPVIAVLLQPHGEVTTEYIHHISELIYSGLEKEQGDSVTLCIGEQFLPIHNLASENELLHIILEHNKNRHSTILNGRTYYTDVLKNIIGSSFEDEKRRQYRYLLLCGNSTMLLDRVISLQEEFSGNWLVEELMLLQGVTDCLIEELNLQSPDTVDVDPAKRIKQSIELICNHISQLNSSHENVVVQRTKRFIDENIGGDLTLLNIADSLHYNPSYLSRLFSETTNNTLSSYIKEQRLKLIKSHLCDGDMMIKDICTAVGLESVNYLSRFFKKEMGITPKEYRERNRGVN